MFAQRTWWVLLLALCAAPVHAAPPTPPSPPAQPAASSTPAPCLCAKPPPEPPTIEVTFGSSQLFAHQSFLGKSGQVKEEIIPVTSALLMIEWLAHTRVSALALFNLPLVTQKVIVNGEIREEFVAPSVAAGARLSAVRLQVFAASYLELQLAALAGITIGSQDGDRIFPLVAGRLHFVNRDGFALYMGTAYAFQKDTLALLYGIGHRF